jgi:hypothetical protein
VTGVQLPSDLERGWVVTSAFIYGTDTHEVDTVPVLCANCSRRYFRGERCSSGVRGDPDGPGPKGGVGPARFVCRACRPFLTRRELAALDHATLPGWLHWLVDRWRER